MFGADVAALRQFADALGRRRHDIDGTRQRLATAVETLPWAGADRDHFVEEWRRTHAPALTTIVADLDHAAGEAFRHADRQERASSPAD